ncbi:hypothetical protein SARC_14231 [Sphaeroforma arctica JP610]|uniref:Amino acid transporter transmembrane domain-containing protein n=1 Tax=Sphaeroforma arctica JP610 TaxID=667725 RepID=A0A0L0F914_9EUKA|nr:hypothetical protein SARC_14231 [Sphaeroforma arctica JP610]KNC73210.1 hypothetical protein SARC_14231 [Sphaeroforma arctica JP610]|eukprot:XP_014147112.1 hypothetical protein SARC_14231 [Sphaeroforma arctica JP610]
MKRPHDWNKLFPYCWAIVALILFSTGIVGFLGYGSATKDIIFLSMAPDNGISTTAAVFFLLYGLYTIPLWINVLFQTFERRWGIPTHTHRGERVCMCGLSLNPFVARLMFRTSILAAQLTIALAIPYSFGYLQALVGSCAIALGTFILPAIMYRHFKRKQLGMRSLGGLYFIMLVGGVILVCGTIVAIINIVNHISEYSLFGGF